ncbi:UNVERIFIED_CONTAM: hypothetical protein Sradi_3313700 [Sesamum radiatum]|uniref:GRF-type domain-containing protein n=1 Tax=Sesamum radiatum TaxID=300843 RepID=A0AAW2R188_SESRA
MSSGCRSACSSNARSRKQFDSNNSTDDETVIRVCNCGLQVVTRTAWTTANPGRRFCGCPGTNGSYCRTFTWVDPPMCQRSKEVILDLLKRLSRSDALIEELNQHFTKPVDRVFITSLVKTIEQNHFPHVDPNITAIRTAVAKVNQCFGTCLCYRYGLYRWNHLKERHATFTWLINRPGVRWIPRLKLLLVDEHLWEEIERENHLAQAYRWDIEPA